MKKLLLFSIVAVFSIMLIVNYEPIFASHTESHHDNDDSMKQQDEMMMSTIDQHHPHHNGLCAPGFAVLGEMCVLDNRCGPGAYAGKVCVMNGVMKEYLKPLHQKYSGISVENIICAEGKQLMFKSSDASPACINSESVEKLEQRGGWQSEIPHLPCTLEYMPVCGVDGVSYGNMCNLDANHMAAKHDGECMSPSETTTILYIDSNLVDCVGVGPQQCMLVREDPNAEWEMFYDAIEGFEYQEGISYKLGVIITEIENPPADSSSLKYTLVELLDPLIGSDRDEHGCIGSAGYQWSEKEQQCLRPWENPEAFDSCGLEPDPGLCKAYMPRYYFDETTNSCQEFIWGGCGGVVPFESLSECQMQCGN